MFTGLINSTGCITAIEKSGQGLNITIEHNLGLIHCGESVAVNGVCVTALKESNKSLSCQLSPETLSKTNLARLSLQGAVNLEQSLRLSDRLGGHFVLGHVDGVVSLINREPQGDFVKLDFSHGTHPEWLIDKGSVTIEGISLTVNALNADFFSCMVVPHTLDITNLSDVKQGDNLNIEYDYLAKIVKSQRLAEPEAL